MNSLMSFLKTLARTVFRGKIPSEMTDLSSTFSGQRGRICFERVSGRIEGKRGDLWLNKKSIFGKERGERGDTSYIRVEIDKLLNVKRNTGTRVHPYFQSKENE